jgi:uncharacterized protein (TIGR03437 family)
MKFLNFRLTKIFLLVVFSCVLFFAPTTAQQPFLTTLPSAPSYVICSYEVGNSVIIGTGNGVFRLSSDGTSWVSSSAGLPENLGVKSFLAHGNTLFIETGNGYFRSKDQGNNWIAVNVPSGFSILHSTGTFFYAIDDNTRTSLIRSVDGESWESVVNNSYIPRVSIGSEIFATFYVLELTSRKILLRSSDNGKNWKELKLPKIEGDFGLIGNNGILYLTGILTGTEVSPVTGYIPIWNVIYCSADLGLTWELISIKSFVPSQSFWVSGANMLVLRTYANFPLQLYQAAEVSSDAGRTWKVAWEVVHYYRGSGPGVILPVPELARNGFIKGNSLHIITESTGLKINRNYTKPTVTAVSAANYKIAPLSNESIVSVFGSGMSLTTAAAASVPLPTSLENTSVTITDNAGNEKLAPLYFISPTQINFQIPAGMASGVGTVTVNLYNQIVGRGIVSITNTSPGLFTVNQTGEGFAAANVQRVKANGVSVYEAVVQYDSGANKYKGIPINVNSATDQVYVNLYGTGIRGRSNLTNVKASVGGVDVPVSYAGAQGSYVGVDQINILLPSTLAGKGEVDVALTVDGQVANAVKLSIQ